jgi:phosphate-selective porin OprO/OprP
VGKGGFGAWEVVARYSTTDLSDAAIAGGEERNVTLGLNWYPAPSLRFMLDYVHVLEVANGKFAGSEPSALVLRSAVFW